MLVLTWITNLRTPLGMFVKFVFFVGLCGVFNHLRDVIFDGSDAKTLWVNTIDASFTAVPAVIIAMAVIAKLARLQKDLERQAETDQLTGLPNRRAFFDKKRPSHDPGLPPVVAILDVDHFKNVNDTYGHLVGDECLKRFGRKIQSLQGADLTVCRYGGEEFAAVISAVSLAKATQGAHDFAQGEVMDIDGHRIEVSSSIGLAEWTSDLTLEDALRRADHALYRAKASGRKRALAAAPVDIETLTPNSSMSGARQVASNGT